MSNIVIETYFRIDERFVPVEQFSGKLPDESYIEGAIFCVIDGCEILRMDQWDLVDQLWPHIVEGLRKLDQGLIYESFFPDQPLRLRLESIDRKNTKITIGNRSAYVDSMVFRSVMKRGAVEFFSRMKNIIPRAAETWDRYQKEAETIRG
ncbi:hypothetical protein [Luteolibacter sp. LG18]|uniref:hypothetical protein n=1 Tax=Luteolibacter sp. LG18 TaxID=2819286 RepID=UPI002B2AB55D|nr:hypothetical protein llg_23630 [Luteolibacter sp. LG18]